MKRHYELSRIKENIYNYALKVMRGIIRRLSVKMGFKK